MKRTTLWLACVALALCSASAVAQDFQLQSAETIDKGNFKIGAYPTVLFGKSGDDESFGVATRLGYGVTSRFDVEARLSFFENMKMYGGDLEFWLVRGHGLDASLSAGFHKADFDSGFDSKAFDVAGIFSRKLVPNLDVYAAVTASFESIDNVEDSRFERYYIVPGFEYRIHPNLDLAAEFGLGLNDDSPNYLGAGLSFYIR